MSHLGTIQPSISRVSEPELHATGLFLVVCLLVGGGTDKGISSDLVLQMLALPFIFAFFMQFPSNNVEWPTNAFVAAILALMLCHLIPTFGFNGRAFLVSVDGGHGLDSLVMVLVWIGVFHAVTQIRGESQAVLFLYVLAAMLLNLVFSFVQFSSAGFAEAAQFLPYKINAGFFENENHLAALFYVCVPMIIVLSHRIGIRFLEVPILAALVGFQFVIGSRAGLVLIVISIALSYAVFSRRKWASVGLTAATVALGCYLAWHFAPEWWSKGGPLSRTVFTERAWQAALDHFPVGVGFGNFQLIYPSYETAGIIVSDYVNHAHNDYLELFLEGSLLAVLLIVCYFGFLAKKCFKGDLTDIQTAAVLGISFLLVHSFADYPLRTLGLGVVFAVLNAILFSTHSKTEKNQDQVD